MVERITDIHMHIVPKVDDGDVDLSNLCYKTSERVLLKMSKEKIKKDWQAEPQNF